MIDTLLSLVDRGPLWAALTLAAMVVVLVVGDRRGRQQDELRADAWERMAQHKLYPDAGPGRRS